MSNAYSNSSKPLKTTSIRDRGNTLDIRIGTQPSESGTNERWLVMCNGRTEWVEKYTQLPKDMAVAPTTGYMSWDHRGQGGSGGARAWIDDYMVYAKDMADAIHATVGDKPYNLVCHSMGALIALKAIIEGLVQPRCVVLSSPLIGLPHHPMPPAAAYHISRAFTAIGLGHLNTGGGQPWKVSFEENSLTHSAERYHVIQTSPFPVPGATFEWVKASYIATQDILDPVKLKRLTMPVLVLCGTDEQVVDIESLQPWVQAARQHAPGSVDLHWIQGGKHELLFESKPYYDKTLALITEWFSKIGFPI